MNKNEYIDYLEYIAKQKGKDAARLEWLFENVANFECSENIAGNIEKFIIPATRAAIDAEMARHTTKPKANTAKP